MWNVYDEKYELIIGNRNPDILCLYSLCNLKMVYLLKKNINFVEIIKLINIYKNNCRCDLKNIVYSKRSYYFTRII